MPDPKSYEAAKPAASTSHEASPSSLADLAALIQQLAKAGGVPITLSQAPALKIDTAKLLQGKPRLTVAFPPCSDELLALIRTSDSDEVTGYFKEYFKFQRHQILGQLVGNSNQIEELSGQLGANLDNDLLTCRKGDQGGPVILSGGGSWPSDCCFCRPCVTLDGARNPSGIVPGLKRLFVGDLLWLFYFERLGIFQILGVILDAFAYSGRLPISNGALEAGIKDDVIALVLEAMVRQTKMGTSSTVRDRACAYRTSLGWNSAAGGKLALDTEVNTGFNNLFHKFISSALEFYKDKSLAVAIRGSAAPVAPPSVATLITISNTLDVLKKRFEAFSYGRNYYNTLSGIVWAVAGMSVIRELRTTLGIPPAFEQPHEFIPAAYDLLVLKRPVTHGETNRYDLHRSCAQNGRDILLDLEVINLQKNNPGEELELWLTQIEAKVEAYRTSYRTLTGTDLGAPGAPTIEQQA